LVGWIIESLLSSRGHLLILLVDVIIYVFNVVLCGILLLNEVIKVTSTGLLSKGLFIYKLVCGSISMFAEVLTSLLVGEVSKLILSYLSTLLLLIELLEQISHIGWIVVFKLWHVAVDFLREFVILNQTKLFLLLDGVLGCSGESTCFSLHISNGSFHGQMERISDLVIRLWIWRELTRFRRQFTVQGNGIQIEFKLLPALILITLIVSQRPGCFFLNKSLALVQDSMLTVQNLISLLAEFLDILWHLIIGDSLDLVYIDSLLANLV
jgi:hypothetical protein